MRRIAPTPDPGSPSASARSRLGSVLQESRGAAASTRSGADITGTVGRPAMSRRPKDAEVVQSGVADGPDLTQLTLFFNSDVSVFLF